MRSLLLLVTLVGGGFGCAHNVAQDRATGADGKRTGARPLVFDNGEGKATGIVTYPGGDRVDWTSIALPEGKHGTLALEMSWTTPRPGLQLRFDVFDQWNHVVIPAAVQREHTRRHAATIPDAAGTYFVRIYAPARGDAGAYKLVAAFEETRPREKVDVTKLPIPNPPKLPEIPDPAVAVMPPTPPTPPPTPPQPPQPPTPPVVVPDPIETRVLTLRTTTQGVEITVAGGSANGVTKTWKPAVLRGTTSAKLSGGAGTILQINRTTTVIRVGLTADMLKDNPNVILAP